LAICTGMATIEAEYCH